MRTRMSRAAVMIVLLTCLVCPVLETFDHWDHTLQTGNDTEYTLVLLALCVGMVSALARLIVILSCNSSPTIVTSIACNLNGSLLFMTRPIALAASESPPLLSRRI